MSAPGFESLLDKDPADWHTRLVYADWLDEHGETDRAHAQRWMADREKHPLFFYEATPINNPSRGWEWRRTFPPTNGLHPRVFAHITNHANDDAEDSKVFPSRQAAERALIEALANGEA